jgi:hypothetical protein
MLTCHSLIFFQKLVEPTFLPVFGDEWSRLSKDDIDKLASLNLLILWWKPSIKTNLSKAITVLKDMLASLRLTKMY